MAIPQNEDFVLELEGEFDLNNISLLRERLSVAISSATPSIIVDMAEVTFIDSSGLAELVGAKNALGPGQSIAIRALRPNVKKTFDITGLSQLFGLNE